MIISRVNNKSKIFTPSSENDFNDLYILQKKSLSKNNIRVWTQKEIIQLMNRDNISAYILQNNNVNYSYIIFSHIASECEFLSIGTVPEMRQNGFASKLIEFFLQKYDADNDKNVFLEVADNNHQAIELYKKFGFKKVGVRKKYYSNNINAIIMRKSY